MYIVFAIKLISCGKGYFLLKIFFVKIIIQVHDIFYHMKTLQPRLLFDAMFLTDFELFQLIWAWMVPSFLSIRLLSTKWKCQRDHYSLCQKIFPYYMSSSNNQLHTLNEFPISRILNYNLGNSEFFFELLFNEKLIKLLSDSFQIWV